MDSTSRSSGSTSKSDEQNPEYRSRVVASELRSFHPEMGGTFAAMPSLERVKMMLSAESSSQLENALSREMIIKVRMGPG
eukprot:4381228-Amphidinium_carterae.1